MRSASQYRFHLEHQLTKVRVPLRHLPGSFSSKSLDDLLEILHAPIFSIGDKKSTRRAASITAQSSQTIIGWSSRIEAVEPCACSTESVDHGISIININPRLILSLLIETHLQQPSNLTQQVSKSHPRELPSRSCWNRYRRSTAPMVSFSCRKRTSSP